MEVLGYIGALFIGLVLGLIGGGGSILTVPILVYMLGFNPVVATAYSLFVVGTTSLVGAVRNMFKGMVDYKTAFIFALPAFMAVYATRAYLLPAIPEELWVFRFRESEYNITKNLAIMIFFAFMMLAASISMINNKKKSNQATTAAPYNYSMIIPKGLLVGVLTGVVGAGGGFLIIPALVLLAKLPMKNAVATSLLIIAINSLIGFLGDVNHLEIDWTFILLFTSLSVIGIFIGIWLNKFIEGNRLKTFFGWFVLVMGIYVIYKELTV